MQERFSNRLIGCKELSQYLGVSISVIYRLVAERRIPSLRIGRLHKFDLQDIDRWIEQTKTAQKKVEG